MPAEGKGGGTDYGKGHAKETKAEKSSGKNCFSSLGSQLLLVSLRFGFGFGFSFLFSPKIASDFFHVLMLPCCLPTVSSLCPSSCLCLALPLPRLGILDFHTHTNTHPQCVRELEGETCQASACRLLAYLPPSAPPASPSRSTIHRTDGNLLNFCVEIHMQKPNQFRPSFAGASCDVASCRSAFLSFIPTPFFHSSSFSPSLYLFCVLFFFTSFSLSHFYAELGCLQLGKEINNRLLDFS